MGERAWEQGRERDPSSKPTPPGRAHVFLDLSIVLYFAKKKKLSYLECTCACVCGKGEGCGA